MKSAVSTVVVVAAVALVAYLGHLRIVSLETHSRQLTERLTEVNDILKSEVERSARVEAAAVRLEKGSDERQARLRIFERQLVEVARNSTEARALLRTVVPDVFLDGLRSFPKSSHSGVLPEQGSGKHAGAY